MARHSWTNRIAPPVVACAVVGCVWYSLDSRPSPSITPPAQQLQITRAAGVKPAVVSAEPTPVETPVITKLGTQVQFSLKPMAHAHIQKVEFYVESQFVGAAYNQPYSVAVSENNLPAGTHTVTAKIFTNDSFAQSAPANFTSQPAKTPAPAVDSADGPAPALSGSSGAPTVIPSTPTVIAPATDLAGTAANDGTSATLTWTASAYASQYQIWRDGSQIALATGVGYSDTNLSPGQTYDYNVIAVASNGKVSDPTDTIAVTMPTTPVAGSNNQSSPQSGTALQPAITSNTTSSNN